MTAGGLDDAGRRRVEANMGYARALARPFVRSWPRHEEDLEATAMAALAEATHSFDPAGRRSYTSWVYRVVHWRIIDYLRGEARASNAANVAELPDAPAPGPPASASVDAGDLAAEVLSRLTPASAEAVRSVFMEGRTYREAGGELGVSHNAVYLRCARAIEQTRALSPALTGAG